MIDRKYYRLVLSFLMSLFMSFVINVFNIGLVSAIASIWLSTWLFSFMIAFPAVVIVSPLAHKFVNLVFNE